MSGQQIMLLGQMLRDSNRKLTFEDVVTTLGMTYKENDLDEKSSSESKGKSNAAA